MRLSRVGALLNKPCDDVRIVPFLPFLPVSIASSSNSPLLEGSSATVSGASGGFNSVFVPLAAPDPPPLLPLVTIDPVLLSSYPLVSLTYLPVVGSVRSPPGSRISAIDSIAALFAATPSAK